MFAGSHSVRYVTFDGKATLVPKTLYQTTIPDNDILISWVSKIQTLVVPFAQWGDYGMKKIKYNKHGKISFLVEFHTVRTLSLKEADATGIILCMRPANERWRCIVTSPPIGWAHTHYDPWSHITKRIFRELKGNVYSFDQAQNKEKCASDISISSLQNRPVQNVTVDRSENLQISVCFVKINGHNVVT